MTFSYKPLPYYPDATIDAVIAAMAPLRQKQIRTEVDLRIRQNFTTLLANRKQNVASPGTAEKMGMIITGETGSGKSRLVDKYIEKDARVARQEGEEHRPFVSLRLTGQVNLKLAGYDTARALGAKFEEFSARKNYWTRVAQLSKELNTQVVHFDETHDIFTSANVLESRRILSMLKGLMDRPDHPMIVILTGTNELKRRMSSEETNRRLIPVSIPPIDVDNDWDDVVETVNDYCAEARLKCELSDEDVLRLIHAAGGQLGLTFARALDGIQEALFAGDTVLTRMNLAHAYHRNADIEEEFNIFVATDYLKISPGKAEIQPSVPNKTEQKPKRKGVKRKETSF
jgi:hypothetical protein